MKVFDLIRTLTSIGLITFGMGMIAPVSFPAALLLVTLAVLIAPWGVERREVRSQT